MKIKTSIGIFGAVAALCLAPVARAQCGVIVVCGSAIEYDSSQNAVYAYSYTLNYYLLQTVGVAATLYTPENSYNQEDFNEGLMASASFGPLNDSSGYYTIYGTHYDWADNWAGMSADSQDVSFRSYDPTPQITGVSPTPWNAGESYDVTIIGSGFGSNPTVTITGPDGWTYYNGSCAGMSCDTSISVWFTVPDSAPDGEATVTVTSQGYGGMGFLGPPGQSSSSSAQVQTKSNSAGQCPTGIQIAGTTDLPLANAFPDYLTGIGIAATMQVTGPPPYTFNGASVTESVSLVSNSCPSNLPTQCTGNSIFTVGPDNGGNAYGTPIPAIGNSQFWDSHALGMTSDLLAVPAGPSPCQVVCSQTYSACGNPIGSFTINRTFSHGTLSTGGNDVPVTFVDVTKTVNQ